MTATVKDGLGGCRFVEWVETIGSSIANAETKAIDLLSVSADRVEVEVLNDVRVGAFGRIKSPARVRASIVPVGGCDPMFWPHLTGLGTVG